MKIIFSPKAGRIALAATLLSSSVALVAIALTTQVADTHGASSIVNTRPILAGPSGYYELVRKFPGLSTSKRKAINGPAAVIPAASPAPIDNGPKLGFENFEGPGVLTTEVTSSQGGNTNTAAYIAHDAGEPSIGVNWNTNVTAFQSDLETLFVTFNDSCNLATRKDTWVHRPAPTSQGADQDPIGFVDRVTGRTWSAQLTLTSPTCKTSFTDDDGMTWVPTAGFGIGSGIDHQTIGSGPYHAPLVNPPPPAYPHAVYYCSQLPQAACARSDNGGVSFGPVVGIDPVADAHCIGIHGHVKIAPDGTVYVPSNNCDGQGSVIVSENNGISWAIRHVTGTSSGGDIIDGQVAIDDAGKIYFTMANGDGKAIAATSSDRGLTWDHVFDVGAAYGVLATGYPYVTAADPNRAAVAFLGSTKQSVGISDHSYLGVWHLYIAATFDGGATWTTTDATPNDPVQRGCIWAQGGADICRNLLDFIGMTTDKEGRIEVGYVDGCPDGNCAQALVNADGSSGVTGNAYTARGVIARQSSGRRLVASFNPPSPTSVPGMPLITARRLSDRVKLSWSEADSGNLMINNYQILRSTSSGTETLLTTVGGAQTGGTYDDLTATNPTKTYYYRVVAVNSAGASCANNELAVPYQGDSCTGFIVQKTPPNHPEQSTQGQAPASLAIDYVAVAEPPATSNFMFKMKVTNLASVPPNSRWRIVWNTYAATGQQFYVGMKTDSSSVATFEYGHIATAVVGLVLGVPTETKEGNALAGSNFNADGTITIIVPKSALGNPQPGALLGSVNGRTFTGDTPETSNLERSNALIDHTFAKAQRDNGHPAATYVVTGNTVCPPGTIVPASVVSRKTHGSVGDFDVDLLNANPGIECRTGGPGGNHKIVFTFVAPVTVSSASCGGTAATPNVSGSVVTVNCTGVPNAHTIAISLVGVSDGTNAGNVSVPMGVLEGDTTANKSVNSSDISQTQSQSGQPVTASNFREDVTVNGFINSSDISVVQSRSGSSLAP
jgi:hypothetical protein